MGVNAPESLTLVLIGLTHHILVALRKVDGDLSEELAGLVDHANSLIDDVETHVTNAMVMTDVHVQHSSLATKFELSGQITKRF